MTDTYENYARGALDEADRLAEDPLSIEAPLAYRRAQVFALLSLGEKVEALTEVLGERLQKPEPASPTELWAKDTMDWLESRPAPVERRRRLTRKFPA